jgi:phosphatidate cytidylyltransferase
MSEFQKRIFTSLLLFFILYLSLKSYLILSLVLFFIIFILLNEFNNIFLRIFSKQKLLHLILIFITIIYLIYFSLSILIFLNFENYDNKIILLFLLSITISTDIGGYCFGKFFKGKKITKISPNKTYSGLIGSLFLSIIISFIFFRNLDLSFNYLTITILLSIISQIGDLVVSFLKRKAKIKDTSSFLPGHGGLLDRIDGMLFALPLGLIIISL